MHEEVIEKHALLKFLRKSLSSSQQQSLVKSVNYFRKKNLEKRETPGSVVLFVTNRCQMGCDFCLYKQKLNTAEQLMSVDEIKQIAKSLKDLPRLVLTGGEPFLRDDLDLIVAAFNQYAKTKTISISTNGFQTKRIRDKVEQILKGTKLNIFKIQVSIDSLGVWHDELRVIDGAFDNGVRTLKALKVLQQKHKNLYVEIASMVNPSLINNIQAFVDYFQEMRIPIKFSIIRSENFGLFGLNDKDTSNIPLPKTDSGLTSLEELEKFYITVKKINEEARYKFWSHFQQLKFKNSLTILNTQQRQFPCYAGKIDAVIYHNADVSFCENTVPIGNLRDYHFDFLRLWRSPKAEAFRGNIKKCVCIHGCNLVTSMSFDDHTLSQLASRV